MKSRKRQTPRSNSNMGDRAPGIKGAGTAGHFNRWHPPRVVPACDVRGGLMPQGRIPATTELALKTLIKRWVTGTPLEGLAHAAYRAITGKPPLGPPPAPEDRNAQYDAQTAAI